tara:strand:- start:2348 stop:2812 length:465 start_codon:yes stop_codon:yes gene_type:complete
MKDRLLEILEKYEARSGDEEKFIEKHAVAVLEGPGYAEIRAAIDFTSFAERSGYSPGEDESVYEEYAKTIQAAVDEFIEEASEEDRLALEELFSTEEGYDEFISSIMEDDKDEDEDDDEDDDEDEDEDDDEDDDEDEVVEKNPKLKKEAKKAKK